MVLTDHLFDSLAQNQNADGGWGYFPGKTSRVEPTAWSVLGLIAHGKKSAESDRALDWLVKTQNADGSYSSFAEIENSLWMTGPALLAMEAAKRPQDSVARENAFKMLLNLKAKTIHKQNNMRSDLEGWGWTTNAFSWVEPTCFALLALRAYEGGNEMNPQLQRRLQDGETILWARRCGDGGWNYGNFGNSDYALASFPVTTAIALLTLQQRAGDPWIQQGWGRIEELRQTQSSLLSLSWGILAGRGLKKDVTPWIKQMESHVTSSPSRANAEIGLALAALGNALPIFQFNV